jgi:plastocyanin
MKSTFYAGSIAVFAMMILTIASISAAPVLLFTQTAIASIDDEQGGVATTTTNDTDMTASTATAVPDNATTHRVAVGGGNITFSINQFSPQTTEIQTGESVTFFAPSGSLELHNVIFDLTNSTTISDLGVPFTLPSDVSAESLQLAPPYNLGEPMIQNTTATTTDGTTQALIGFNKVAWQPSVVDQNGNAIYPEEEELRQQMQQLDQAFEQGAPMPPPLSASYTMNGSERVVSSGIILDVGGFSALEKLFPEEGEEASAAVSQQDLIAEDNHGVMTNTTTTTTTDTPAISSGEEATSQQEEQQVEEFPPSIFPTLGSFTVTFEEPGTYEYFCAFHPGMFGQVVVGGSGDGEGN